MSTETGKVAVLTEALAPFVKAFQKKLDRHAGSPARQKWNEDMPGEWPIELTVTMQDCRKARAALAQLKEPSTHDQD